MAICSRAFGQLLTMVTRKGPSGRGGAADGRIRPEPLGRFPSSSRYGSSSPDLMTSWPVFSSDRIRFARIVTCWNSFIFGNSKTLSPSTFTDASILGS